MRKVLALLLVAISACRSAQIAICINGQTARWLPEQIVTGLLESNPEHFFHLFLNLQFTNDMASVFTTYSHLSFKATPINHMDQFKMFDFLSKLYNQRNNSKLQSFHLSSPKSHDEWKIFFQIPRLDRIYLYEKKQDVILNLFHHQQRCHDQIISHEEFHREQKIDYIINLREDIYFFKPIFLSTLLPNNDNNNPMKVKYTNITINSNSQNTCNLVVKDCLKWHGVNMRFNLFPREYLTPILGKKFQFYRYLIKLNITIRNPEIFEYQLFKHQRINICEYSINHLPLAAIRYVHENQSCFIPQEVDGCIPRGFGVFVQKNKCSNYYREVLRKMNYTEAMIEKKLKRGPLN
jgi:hypothetical protein